MIALLVAAILAAEVNHKSLPLLLKSFFCPWEEAYRG